MLRDLRLNHACYRASLHLDPAHQQEDDDDNRDESESTTGTVTPLATVWPGRQRAEQEEDENNE